MAELPKNLKYVGATIIIERTGQEYHTVTDWNLIITSAVNISEPEQQTSYIEIPGANAMLDVSEALSGRLSFRKRNISIALAGIGEQMTWDTIISSFRNAVEGKVVHIIFDNDPNYYWKGRAHITGYERAMECGRFNLELPEADPYKYNVRSNVEPWLWDPFDFENDVVPEEPIINVNGTTSITIPAGNMYTVPEFTVSELTSLTLTVNGRNYNMTSGYNYFPGVMVNGDVPVTLTFNGKGRVIMEYRGGSL